MKSLILILSCAALFGQNLDTRIAQEVAAMEAKLVETRRDFHMHPELSNFEKRTGEVVAAKLRAMGVDEVKTGVAGHGVVALIKGGKPGPVVAWRTDMDALPIDESTFQVPYRSTNKGVKHACGRRRVHGRGLRRLSDDQARCA
jgi:amidohydrolase